VVELRLRCACAQTQQTRDEPSTSVLEKLH
jgi:hypothetical protein